MSSMNDSGLTSEREEYLRKVTVGELKPHDSTMKTGRNTPSPSAGWPAADGNTCRTTRTPKPTSSVKSWNGKTWTSNADKGLLPPGDSSCSPVERVVQPPAPHKRCFFPSTVSPQKKRRTNPASVIADKLQNPGTGRRFFVGRFTTARSRNGKSPLSKPRQPLGASGGIPAAFGYPAALFRHLLFAYRAVDSSSSN